MELAVGVEVEVGFEYQVFGGLAEAMHNTEWSATPTKRMTGPGEFTIELSGLKAGTEYQYRALVKHPKITVRGDHKRIVVH